MNALLEAKPFDLNEVDKEIYSGAVGTISSMREWLINFRRRGVNKSEKLGPMLDLLSIDTKYSRYDKVIFVLFDSSVIAKLERIGFVREDRCRYRNSSFTMYCQKHNIVFEIVQKNEWPDLVRCIHISNVTGYFNLNDIHDALYQEDDLNMD